MQPRQLTVSDTRRIFSVSQLVNDVKVQLETNFRDFWVKGEISNLRTPPSGHIYFTLKDASAQIQAVCFRMQARYLKFQPEDGMELLARGSVSMYPPRGQVQLIVEHLEPVGSGALQLAFEQLKKRLEKDGLFDQSRKKDLPLLPSKIGIVTSPTGAAVQDILRVLQRRNDRLDVLIFPATVQGAEASQEISAASDSWTPRPRSTLSSWLEAEDRLRTSGLSMRSRLLAPYFSPGNPSSPRWDTRRISQSQTL